MSDRELLELAAKAAGYDYSPQHGAIVVDGVPGAWNPLTDDGDALRLAVKLRMCVSVEYDAQAAWWCGDALETVNQPLGEDETAAVRRAIVRAATEIGRSMP